MLNQSTPMATSELKQARIEKGLSARATARAAEIDPGQLGRVEAGKSSLSIEALHRLARVLDLDDLADDLERYFPERVTKAS